MISVKAKYFPCLGCAAAWCPHPPSLVDQSQPHPGCHPEVSVGRFPPIEKFRCTGRSGGWAVGRCGSGPGVPRGQCTEICPHSASKVRTPPHESVCMNLAGACVRTWVRIRPERAQRCGAKVDRHGEYRNAEQWITGAAQSSLGWSDVRGLRSCCLRLVLFGTTATKSERCLMQREVLASDCALLSHAQPMLTIRKCVPAGEETRWKCQRLDASRAAESCWIHGIFLVKG